MNDANMNCMLQIFTMMSHFLIEMNTVQIKFSDMQNMKRLWAKMCRLVANLSQEKSDQNFFISKEFMQNLNKILEKQQQFQHVLMSFDEYKTHMCENNQIDMDFFHSLTRFVR
jgi:hypothetical protein